MNHRAALGCLFLFAVTPLSAGAQAIGATALVGSNVGVAVRAYGVPTSVASHSDGHHFIFDAGGVALDTIVDAEGGVIRAIDLCATVPATFTVDLDGKPRTFAFGTYTMKQADADLATVADYSLDAMRLYRISQVRELVLGFDKTTGALQRAVAGDRTAIVRLGLVPNEPVEKAFPYVAPVLQHSALAKDGTGSQATVVRIDIDRLGVIKTIDVVIPSGDAVFDSGLAKKLASDDYRPAKLGVRPIASSVYREIRH